MPRFVLFLVLCFFCSVFCGSSFAAEDAIGSDEEQVASEETAESPQALRLESLKNYCTALSEADRPAKGCGCLDKAYKDQAVRKTNSMVESYNYWITSLNDISKILQAHSEPNMVGTVESFCARWYSGPDSLLPGAVASREMAMLKTPEFKDEQERTEFSRQSRELKKSTRGLNQRFCRAKIEIAAYEKKMKEDPFASEQDSEVYQQLKLHSVCRKTSGF